MTEDKIRLGEYSKCNVRFCLHITANSFPPQPTLYFSFLTISLCWSSFFLLFHVFFFKFLTSYFIWHFSSFYFSYSPPSLNYPASTLVTIWEIWLRMWFARWPRQRSLCDFRRELVFRLFNFTNIKMTKETLNLVEVVKCDPNIIDNKGWSTLYKFNWNYRTIKTNSIVFCLLYSPLGLHMYTVDFPCTTGHLS